MGKSGSVNSVIQYPLPVASVIFSSKNEMSEITFSFIFTLQPVGMVCRVRVPSAEFMLKGL